MTHPVCPRCSRALDTNLLTRSYSCDTCMLQVSAEAVYGNNQVDLADMRPLPPDRNTRPGLPAGSNIIGQAHINLGTVSAGTYDWNRQPVTERAAPVTTGYIITCPRCGHDNCGDSARTRCQQCSKDLTREQVVQYQMSEGRKIEVAPGLTTITLTSDEISVLLQAINSARSLNETNDIARSLVYDKLRNARSESAAPALPVEEVKPYKPKRFTLRKLR